MNFGKFQENLCRNTRASVNFCISFFNNLDETSTCPDEDDRDLLDESDNDFSCSDDDSFIVNYKTEFYNSPNSKNGG